MQREVAQLQAQHRAEVADELEWREREEIEENERAKKKREDRRSLPELHLFLAYSPQCSPSA